MGSVPILARNRAPSTRPRWPRRAVWAALACGLVAGCAPNAIPPFARDALPTIKGAADHGAVTLLWHEHVRYEVTPEKGLEAVLTTHTRRHIVHESGRGAAEMLFGYERGFSTVEAFDATVTFPDGTSRSFSIR